MPGTPLRLRPRHQRQDLLTNESFTAACLIYMRQIISYFMRALSTEHQDSIGLEQCTVF